MVRLKTMILFLLLAVFGSGMFIGFSRLGRSEPSWARKYHADCTLCHTIYPRLNRTGYMFRRLGYRFPDEVEKRNQSTKAVSASLEASHQPASVASPNSASTEKQIKSSAYIPAEKTAESEKGRQLYASAGCASCHTIGGEGASVGPALDGIGARRSPLWLTRHITNPQKHIETHPEENEVKSTMMPASDLKPNEIAEIVDYLLTLPPTGQQQTAAVPENKLENYFGVAFLPAVELDRSPGDSKNTFSARDLNIYMAGTLGNNFSFFVQPQPAGQTQGFFQHFEMIQGLWNSGGAKNFVQVRFGQIFDGLNTGFGGLDRHITDSTPFIFQSANSFNPGELGRGASVEFTWRDLTTFKVFTVYQTPPEFDSSGDETPKARRSRTYGFTLEKVIGSKGLSGVQFQYVGGYTPVALGPDLLPALHFQRYSFFVNKDFLDSKNVERVNLISGFTFLRDNRLLDSQDAESSHGYGFFLESTWIPVKRVGLVARYDQLRPTTLIPGNTLKAETAAITYDPTKYTRMMFEYQHDQTSLPTNVYRISWQFNY